MAIFHSPVSPKGVFALELPANQAYNFLAETLEKR